MRRVMRKLGVLVVWVAFFFLGFYGFRLLFGSSPAPFPTVGRDASVSIRAVFPSYSARYGALTTVRRVPLGVEAIGSGVMIKRFVDGAPHYFIWTAAHVVEGIPGPLSLSVEWLLFDRDSSSYSVLSFPARLLALSASDGGYDLALLDINAPELSSLVKQTTLFAKEPIVSVAVPLHHYGTFFGTLPVSHSQGTLSFPGRVLEGELGRYDQLTLQAAPGSSGGGVWDPLGRCQGLITMGNPGTTICWMVPANTMQMWAFQSGMAWATDERAAPPTGAELDAMASVHAPAPPTPSSFRFFTSPQPLLFTRPVRVYE